MNTERRCGNFTSSEIFHLMSNGKAKGSMGAPGWSYIEEKNMERRLGRSIENQFDARPTSWGKLLEKRAFNLLGLDYQLTSDKTYIHFEYDYWVGSPDGFHRNEENELLQAVIDFKAPFTLKSFCQLVDAWNSGGIEKVREVVSGSTKVGEKYFWQLVSNAAITGCDYAELIVYMPYKSELQEIRNMAEGQPGMMWIWSSEEDQLPYINEGGYYKNLNVMRFPVSNEDKQALTERAINASLSLEPRGVVQPLSV